MAGWCLVSHKEAQWHNGKGTTPRHSRLGSESWIYGLHIL